VVDIGVMAYWSVKVFTKLQSSMTKTGLEFLKLIIGICLEFVICYLEFRNAPKEQ
jgi:hypothetical protein